MNNVRQLPTNILKVPFSKLKFSRLGAKTLTVIISPNPQDLQTTFNCQSLGAKTLTSLNFLKAKLVTRDKTQKDELLISSFEIKLFMFIRYDYSKNSQFRSQLLDFMLLSFHP